MVIKSKTRAKILSQKLKLLFKILLLNRSVVCRRELLTSFALISRTTGRNYVKPYNLNIFSGERCGTWALRFWTKETIEIQQIV